LLARASRDPPVAVLAYEQDLRVERRLTHRHGVDLRVVGDGNPGYWNAREVLGRRAAGPVLALDVAKGAAAAAVGWAVGGRRWWPAVVGGGAAMVGHAFPPTRRRGGMAVATFVGTAVVASPRTAAVALGIGAAAWATTQSFERAVQVGVATYPVVQLVVDGVRRTAATGALMTFVGVRFATRPADATTEAVRHSVAPA